MNSARSSVVVSSLLLLLGFLLLVVSGGAAQSSESTAVASSTSRRGTMSQAIRDEIKVVGTLQQVVSDPASGRPQGLHLIVASPQGIFDVSAGPYLAKDVKDSLAVGQPVQVNGVLRTLAGQAYLLARE